MVSEADFDVVRRLLVESDVAISEAGVGGFGSWYVYTALSPRLGIVWDGRDRRLTVCREGERLWAGRRVWDDLWAAREPNEIDPHLAVERLLDFRGSDGSPS